MLVRNAVSGLVLSFIAACGQTPKDDRVGTPGVGTGTEPSNTSVTTAPASSATGTLISTTGTSAPSGGTATSSAVSSTTETSNGSPSVAPQDTSGTSSGASSGAFSSRSDSTTSAAQGPQLMPQGFCYFPTKYAQADVVAAYEDWKATVVTSDGAVNPETGASEGLLRVRKPNSGSIIGSTVSEGQGYGMLLAVYLDDQAVFDALWRYTKLHFNENGLMHWEIHPNGMEVIGQGAASDGDEDMAWALIMAARKWGGQGSLDATYEAEATALINAMWEHEVDHGRGAMLKPGDGWGDDDITNISYFAPAYYKVFGQFVGKEADWNKVVDSSYRIIEASLNQQSGNQDNGLVPAWCDSNGTPKSVNGLPTHFQNDSTRTPFRVAQDYCYFGEPRAKTYMDKITSFYVGVGVANIVDGYDLNGARHPEHWDGSSLPASFVGPAAVGALYSADNLDFVDEAYAALATLKLEAGTIYYQKSWTALSLLMLAGGFTEL